MLASLLLSLCLIASAPADEPTDQELADAGFFMGEFEEGATSDESETKNTEGCSTASIMADKVAMTIFLLSFLVSMRMTPIKPVTLKNK